MDLIEFHNGIKKIEDSIAARGLQANVTGRVNWYGAEVALVVKASEPYQEGGNWSSEREFSNSPVYADAMFEEAREWIASLPGEEDRAIELMIRKLNTIAGELPKGAGDVAKAAWAEIHNMLMAKAEGLAQNGLPSPDRISQLRVQK